MKLPNFESVDERELMNIRCYPYKHLNTYLRTSESDSKYHWHKSNVLGEMYEYLIYEKLLRWAQTIEEMDEFILKGPYVKRNPQVKEGLLYDRCHQIYYNSGGETIAEFDLLFKVGNTRYFVEITNAETKKAIKTMRSGIIRKRNLLQYIFPNDEIHCWIITNYSRDLGISDFTNTEVFRMPKYKINPNILRKPDKSSKLLPPNEPKYKTVYELQYRAFHYFRLLKEIHKQIRIDKLDKVKDTLKVLIKPYAGLIERFFVGKMSTEQFVEYIKDRGHKPPRDLRIAWVYFALKIEEDLSIEPRLYLQTMNNKFYEIVSMENMETKRVYGIKRTTRDIRYLDSSLKQLSADDWIYFRSQA